MSNGVPTFPQTLPAQTVVGRLASTPGIAEAIPIAALSSQLADASTITFTPAGAGAVARSVQSELRERAINVFGYMTAAQIADVKAGTATLDVLDAIRAAGVAAIAAGGTLALYFPFGTYKIRDTSGSDSMFHWTGLNGITIISDNATFSVQQAFTAGQGFNLFYITNCTNVRQIGRINAVGSITKLGFLPPANVVATSPFTGIRTWYMEGSCQDIEVDALSMTGGLNPVTVFKGVSDATTVIAKSLRFGSIKAKTCTYGINFQYTGEVVTIENLDCDDVYRGWFGYGVNNHVVLNSRVKNALFSDIFISGTDGYGSQNIHFLNHLNQDTDGANGQPGIVVNLSIGWGPTILAPCKMKNIDVRFRLNVPAVAANGNPTGVYIQKQDHTAADIPDPTDRGHIYENINLSASIDSANVLFNPIDVFNSGTWGTGEFVRNFNVEDFEVVGSSNPINLFLTSLQGDSFVRNVNTPSKCLIKTSATGKVTAISVRATELTTATGDTGNVTYINCNASAGAQQSFTNKTFINTLVNGVLYAFAADTGGFAVGSTTVANTLANLLSASTAVALQLTRNDAGVAGQFIQKWRNGSGGGTDVATLDSLGVQSWKSKIFPGTDAGVIQTASGIYAGTGVPSNANGVNGDFYFRSDGGAGTSLYQRRAGAWVATGA